eukprot:ctg_769.g376
MRAPRATPTAATTIAAPARRRVTSRDAQHAQRPDRRRRRRRRRTASASGTRPSATTQRSGERNEHARTGSNVHVVGVAGEQRGEAVVPPHAETRGAARAGTVVGEAGRGHCVDGGGPLDRQHAAASGGYGAAGVGHGRGHRLAERERGTGHAALAPAARVQSASVRAQRVVLFAESAARAGALSQEQGGRPRSQPETGEYRGGEEGGCGGGGGGKVLGGEDFFRAGRGGVERRVGLFVFTAASGGARGGVAVAGAADGERERGGDAVVCTRGV